MKKKTILKYFIVAVLFSANLLIISYVRREISRNKGLKAEFSEIQKIARQSQNESGRTEQHAESIKKIIQELNINEFLRNFEIKGSLVRIQLSGISQEQLFNFLKNLSKKVKHQIIQCNIAQDNPGTLTLTIEIQIL